MLFFIFLICEMGLIEKFSILVTSSYDNQQYKVQEHPNSVEAANLLAKILPARPRLDSYKNLSSPTSARFESSRRRAAKILDI